MEMKIILDPLNKFQDVKDQSFYNNNIGFVIDWLQNNDHLRAIDIFKLEYPFGVLEMSGGVLNEDGTYKYPGDPTLYPIAKTIRNKEIIYHYQYGIVGVVMEDKRTFMTRMD